MSTDFTDVARKATFNVLWKRPCKKKFMPVELNEVPAEPWEPEAWHAQELAIQRRLLSTAKILPREMAELEISRPQLQHQHLQWSPCLPHQAGDHGPHSLQSSFLTRATQGRCNGPRVRPRVRGFDLLPPIRCHSRHAQQVALPGILPEQIHHFVILLRH